jgi:hypothetical protein
VFSDVHLGSDINELAPRGRHRPSNLDDDLVALLDHYRVTASASASGLWHLVIAGDFIDFVGMLVADTSDPNLDVSGDAGLGSAASMALRKLVRAVDRHPLVFEALGRFVAAEHRLTFVVGNHDLELHWPVVQLALREAVVASLRRARAPLRPHVRRRRAARATQSPRPRPHASVARGRALAPHRAPRGAHRRAWS